MNDDRLLDAIEKFSGHDKRKAYDFIKRETGIDVNAAPTLSEKRDIANVNAALIVVSEIAERLRTISNGDLLRPRVLREYEAALRKVDELRD